MYKILLALLLISTTAIEADAKGKKPKKPNQRTLTAVDNGKTIALKNGEVFHVLFKNECIGCQYVWEIQQQDTGKIAFTGKSGTFDPNAKPHQAGGQQDRTFHFKAKKPGTSVLSFKYFDNTYSVKLAVK